MDPIKLLAAISTMAVLCQWLTERFFGKWVAGERMVWLSAGVGVGLCLLFRLDATDLLGLPAPFIPFVGQILTGLIVSAGADILHKLLPAVGGTTATATATSSTGGTVTASSKPPTP